VLLTISITEMEQLKNILLIVLAIASAVLWFKPPQYADPIFIDVPVELSDSAKQRIINEANSGLLVGTEDEFVKRFGKVVKKTKWNVKDSLRIQDSLVIDTLQYVSILTDSALYRFSHADSTLGVGFSLNIGLADTVILAPYNTFVHEFWVDSLAYKVKKEEPKKLEWIQWVLEYPDRVSIVALIFMVLGKI